MAELTGKRIVVLVGPDYQDLELWYPRLRLLEAGAEVLIAGPTAAVTYRGRYGYPCVADVAVGGVSADDHHGLVIPGGGMPPKLRHNPAVLQLTRDFARAGRLIASICRGGLIPAAAGVYQGVRATGFADIQAELVRAGVVWDDAPVVIDRQFVSSRQPEDLPCFAKGMLELLSSRAPG